MREYTGHKEPWGEFVDVKVNAPLVLEKEIRRKPKGEVFVSSVCDPYQPLEEKYQLTRKCLKILIENEFPITILTKSSLVKRDFDILKGYPKVELGLTITTMDENLKEKIEPHSSSSQERISVLKEASKLGIKTYCFLGPFLPFIGDRGESLRKLFEAVSSLKLAYIYVDRLNLRFGVWKSLNPFLKRFYPETISKIGKVLFNKGESEKYSSELRQRVENIAKTFHPLNKIEFCF
ncbi:radical SAM protein [bacterium]|nr:radical SAM protein [bacterium]